MKRLIFIICALLFVSAGAFAQSASAVHQKTAQDTTGHAIPKALIKVCALSDTSCSVASTIYSDNVNTVKANPFTADVTGNYEFWAAAGDYTVQVSKAGFATYTYHTSVGPSLSGNNAFTGNDTFKSAAHDVVDNVWIVRTGGLYPTIQAAEDDINTRFPNTGAVIRDTRTANVDEDWHTTLNHVLYAAPIQYTTCGSTFDSNGGFIGAGIDSAKGTRLLKRNGCSTFTLGSVTQSTSVNATLLWNQGIVLKEFAMYGNSANTTGPCLSVWQTGEAHDIGPLFIQDCAGDNARFEGLHAPMHLHDISTFHSKACGLFIGPAAAGATTPPHSAVLLETISGDDNVSGRVCLSTGGRTDTSAMVTMINNKGEANSTPSYNDPDVWLNGFGGVVQLIGYHPTGKASVSQCAIKMDTTAAIVKVSSAAVVNYTKLICDTVGGGAGDILANNGPTNFITKFVDVGVNLPPLTFSTLQVGTLFNADLTSTIALRNGNSARQGGAFILYGKSNATSANKGSTDWYCGSEDAANQAAITGQIRWNALFSTGGLANLLVMNCSSGFTQLYGDFVPNGTRNLGASGTRWNNVFGLTGDFSTAVNSALYKTATNCSSSAAPAVCAAAPSGSVVIAAAGTTVTVNTTAVTANSQILVTEDSSLGTKLSVTCNTTAGRTYAVTARTAGTSFVITSNAAPVTNPACLSYSVIN